MRFSSTLGLTAVAVLAPLSLGAQAPRSARDPVASITAADVTRRIGVIAHDSMGGRDTPSPGLEKTARYIAAEFQRLGLQPGGDSGSYLQWYPLRRNDLDTAASTLVASSGETLRLGTDVSPLFTGGDSRVSGPVVVVPGGIAPEDLRQLGIKGAIVVIVPPPATPDRPTFNVFRVLGAIASEDPAALLITTPADNQRWRTMVSQQLRPRVSPGWSEPGSEQLTALLVRERAIQPLLVRHGVSYGPFQSGEARQGVKAGSLTVTVALKQRGGGALRAPNVVGVLRGSDPVLRDEYIVFSAHMDHVGVGQADERGDSIYNGADDDASGTIGVVELAEAFAQQNPAPRRSMIFLTVSGEEKGLWGSSYFAGRAPVPVSQLVANLNMDMIGRNWKDTIVVIGKEHSDLGTTLNRVNGQHAELGMTAIDDIWPEENFYRRSDHFNFAQKGVPVLFFFNGTHADYHRPSDSPDKIDAEKESRILKLVYYLGLEVANAAEKPRWNPESYRAIVEGAGR